MMAQLLCRSVQQNAVLVIHLHDIITAEGPVEFDNNSVRQKK